MRPFEASSTWQSALAYASPNLNELRVMHNAVFGSDFVLSEGKFLLIFSLLFFVTAIKILGKDGHTGYRGLYACTVLQFCSKSDYSYSKSNYSYSLIKYIVLSEFERTETLRVLMSTTLLNSSLYVTITNLRIMFYFKIVVDRF